MPACPLALARQRLKTIAETLATLTHNCALLRNRDAADLASFQRLVPGSFVYLVICDAGESFAGLSAPLAINAHLYMRQSTAGGTEVDELVAALKSAWLNPVNYPTGELACNFVTYQPSVCVIPDATRVVRVDLVCYFPAS